MHSNRQVEWDFMRDFIRPRFLELSSCMVLTERVGNRFVVGDTAWNTFHIPFTCPYVSLLLFTTSPVQWWHYLNGVEDLLLLTLFLTIILGMSQLVPNNRLWLSYVVSFDSPDSWSNELLRPSYDKLIAYNSNIQGTRRSDRDILIVLNSSLPSSSHFDCVPLMTLAKLVGCIVICVLFIPQLFKFH